MKTFFGNLIPNTVAAGAGAGALYFYGFENSNKIKTENQKQQIDLFIHIRWFIFFNVCVVLH